MAITFVITMIVGHVRHKNDGRFSALIHFYMVASVLFWISFLSIMLMALGAGTV